MLPKLIRILILIIITVPVWRLTRQTKQTVYSVLSFQVAGYEMMLTTQAKIGNVTEKIGNSVKNAQWILEQLRGDKNPGKAEKIEDNQQESLQEKVAHFRSKLTRISRWVAFVVGVIVRKILFDLVFWLKTLILRLRRFVIE